MSALPDLPSSVRSNSFRELKRKKKEEMFHHIFAFAFTPRSRR